VRRVFQAAATSARQRRLPSGPATVQDPMPKPRKRISRLIAVMLSIWARLVRRNGRGPLDGPTQKGTDTNAIHGHCPG
jgi:hypothetical protein